MKHELMIKKNYNDQTLINSAWKSLQQNNTIAGLRNGNEGEQPLFDT